MNMKPEIKALWIEALTSGEYRQGRRALHQKTADGIDSFCCLGVLCDLADKAGQISSKKEVRGCGCDMCGSDPRISYDGATGLLPASVMRWSGVTTGSGEFGGEGGLAWLNDSGKPFEVIAEIIAENF